MKVWCFNLAKSYNLLWPLAFAFISVQMVDAHWLSSSTWNIAFCIWNIQVQTDALNCFNYTAMLTLYPFESRFGWSSSPIWPKLLMYQHPNSLNLNSAISRSIYKNWMTWDTVSNVFYSMLRMYSNSLIEWPRGEMLRTNMTPHLHGHSTNFSVKLASKSYQQAEGNCQTTEVAFSFISAYRRTNFLSKFLPISPECCIVRLSRDYVWNWKFPFLTTLSAWWAVINLKQQRLNHTHLSFLCSHCYPNQCRTEHTKLFENKLNSLTFTVLAVFIHFHRRFTSTDEQPYY